MSDEQAIATDPDEDLVCLFGHTIDKDGQIVWQFSVERKISFCRYLIQLYSWMDGGPTEVKVVSETMLTGKRCNLYLTKEIAGIAAAKNHKKFAGRGKP